MHRLLKEARIVNSDVRKLSPALEADPQNAADSDGHGLDIFHFVSFSGIHRLPPVAQSTSATFTTLGWRLIVTLSTEISRR